MIKMMKGHKSLKSQLKKSMDTVADPGFPVGGRGPRKGGRGLPRRLCFVKFVKMSK